MSFTTLLSFVLAAIAALYIRRILTYVSSDVDRLPGPSTGIASWIWGHELIAFKHEATQMYSIWSKSYGALYRIKGALFHDDIVIVADHAAAHHIFAEPDTFVKSPAFRPPIINLLGRGLVWAEGDEHKLQRKIFSPAFSQESIKKMAPVVQESSERLESRLVNAVLSAKANKQEEITLDILPYTSAATLDIIGRVGFGHDFKALSTLDTSPNAAKDAELSDAQRIRHAWEEITNTGMLFSTFVAPIVIRALPFITKLPIPLIQAQGKCKVIVKGLAGKLLERERGNMERGLEPSDNGRSILGLMMTKKKNGESDTSSTGQTLPDDIILDNIATFTMVGHETTAGAINSTLLELARNPHIQTALRAEILDKGGDLNYDDLAKLELLDAVVKESLRVHPPSPQTERTATRDTVIPLSNPIRGSDGKLITQLHVKKDQCFLIPFTTLNTSESTYSASTAHLFDPSRWLTNNDEGRTKLPRPSDLPSGWSGLTTFCDGPRNCIGWRLAVFEIKAVVAALVRSLVFSEAEKSTWKTDGVSDRDRKVGGKVIIEERISPTLQPFVNGVVELPLCISLA